MLNLKNMEKKKKKKKKKTFFQFNQILLSVSIKSKTRENQISVGEVSFLFS